MTKKIIFAFQLCWVLLFANAAGKYELRSPDDKLTISISTGNKILYSLQSEKDTLLYPSNIALEIENSVSFGVNSHLINAKRNSVNEIINTPVYKKSDIENKYNELVLKFKENFKLTFRAYNQGIAYRFSYTGKNDLLVHNETAEFNFGKDNFAYIPYVINKISPSGKQFYHSFENMYTYNRIRDWDEDRLAFLPLLIECVNNKKIGITEADLIDYPGMYLYNSDKSNVLKGVFAPYPGKVETGGHNMLQEIVTERENYIARISSKSILPWRVLAVSTDDKELTNNDLVYALATPSRINDESWIKPGKVAWDWWNNWNLKGVDFVAGVNNDTYKHYIDFASENNIEYVILDEGWAVNLKADLMQVVPEINLKMLIDYAKSKNVDIILWAGYGAFNKDMESVCKYYSELGVKGFKIDFMDRDDQQMVNFHYKAAEIAAKYHLLVDFHGTYKPTGLQRTFPNVINFEGVYGLEQVKWQPQSIDQMAYDTSLPFIRQLAGPMDYTPGAMKNANRADYRSINGEPMSQGTRCHQLALYVVFEAPLSMLCDSPDNYDKEKECTGFISTIPTIWDETRPVNGSVGQYVTVARRKGNDWYIGSITNWDERQIELDLSFLGTGSYAAVIFKDGINANKTASDYKKETIALPANKKMSVNLASGGGFAAHIYPVK